MADLRFRTFRMKVYGRLCPSSLTAGDRESFLGMLDRLDEDGMEQFYSARSSEPKTRRALEILRDARALADRINVLDRILPALPHAEITECYARLRVLEAELTALEAAGVPG